MWHCGLWHGVASTSCTSQVSLQPRPQSVCLGPVVLPLTHLRWNWDRKLVLWCFKHQTPLQMRNPDLAPGQPSGPQAVGPRTSPAGGCGNQPVCVSSLPGGAPVCPRAGLYSPPPSFPGDPRQLALPFPPCGLTSVSRLSKHQRELGAMDEMWTIWLVRKYSEFPTMWNSKVCFRRPLTAVWVVYSLSTFVTVNLHDSLHPGRTNTFSYTARIRLRELPLKTITNWKIRSIWGEIT